MTDILARYGPIDASGAFTKLTATVSPQAVNVLYEENSTSKKNKMHNMLFKISTL